MAITAVNPCLASQNVSPARGIRRDKTGRGSSARYVGIGTSLRPKNQAPHLSGILAVIRTLVWSESKYVFPVPKRVRLPSGFTV
jgi:hypothetical protein